ncbi:hypothetical protein, partial [Pseudomonas sp. AH2 (2023)]|uniref:hypothetical protein n=1 Tax=Pseudomonas sp. AH2 (2023) TaxID=3048599 RepID=UPI002B225E03
MISPPRVAWGIARHSLQRTQKVRRHGGVDGLRVGRMVDPRSHIPRESGQFTVGPVGARTG